MQTDIDIVYYTGDVVSHINWATTKEGNADLIKQIHRQLKATFGDIPVYPVLGNHDSHPADWYGELSLSILNLS